ATVSDVATGATIAHIGSGGGGVLSAAFNLDGTQIVTAGIDGVARIWDAATGEPLASFAGDATQGTFSDAGNPTLVATGWGTVVDVIACDVCGSFDDVLALSETRVTRGLTPAERSIFLHEDDPSATSAPAASTAPSASAGAQAPGPSPSPMPSAAVA